MRHVGVIDIGKTNAKVAVVDLAARCEIAVLTRPNTVLPGPPWPHFDTDALWSFAMASLSSLHADHGIDGIAVTTHGACAALLDVHGQLAAPVLDYEHTGPERLKADYDALRPPFSATGSPRLPMGLNLGAQIHWMFQTDPDLRGRTARIVTWPQYWGYRLTGRMATDVTSLGCHTDLWDPHHARFSDLVTTLGLQDRMAPVMTPADRLGRITPDIAAQTGLDTQTLVLCGIHDSNASLFPHLLDRVAPFSVVSTGTWVIAMAVGGTAVALDPDRDTLINVNALGAPVPSARFMGGREYDTLMQGKTGVASPHEVDQVLDKAIMLLPSIQSGSGPFPHRTPHWTIAPDPLTPGPAEVAMGYYLALMTAECLAMIGAQGPVIVEGPFARNPHFVAMLASATGRPVQPSPAQTGTAIGAALLFQPTGRSRPTAAATPILPDRRMADYAQRWRSLL